MPANLDLLKREKFSNIFLLVILLGLMYFCYLILSPFLKEIIVAGILVTIFYPVYLRVIFLLRGHMSLAALLMCLLILAIIIAPISYFIFYLAQKALVLYTILSPQLNGNLVHALGLEPLAKMKIFNNNYFNLSDFLLDAVMFLKTYIISGATVLIKSTTGFVVSLFLVVFTMFFLFRDGRSLLTKIMQLTPLSNKYDKLIWIKFRDVSFTTIVATFITAFIQAIIGAIGFLIVGLPALMAGILIFICAFFPYIGSAFVWIPAAIYLLISGHIWQGIFMLIWGSCVVSLIDNLIRPYLIKNKAQVHPLIIFFSILGGIILFGFWGIIFGPLVVAITFTFLHIYELEYSDVLERKVI